MEEGIQNGSFFNPSKGDLSFEQVISEIFAYMKESPENAYEVIVGCDSPSSEQPFFPIAIVVLKTGAGGRFFIKKMRYSEAYMKRFIVWKNRILQEVYLSCELALTLRETLEKENKFGLKYQFEYIHADVGERGKTKEMIKEVVGLIKGSGFEPKIKPFSFAATVVADRYT
jgi:predicted RNase H-related nuclease YkuK (DUF458 family)